MDIEKIRDEALDLCIDIARDYTEEEVKKWCPPLMQRAWGIGDSIIKHELKEAKKRGKWVVL